MKYGTSLRVRHLVGRLEKGEEFIDGMRRLCARERVRAGTFRAIGVFSAAELQEFVGGQYVTRFNAESYLDIASLSGNVSTLGNEVIINASAMLCYSAFGQRQVTGGHLAHGRVFVCEFELSAFDDLMLERTYDAATGLPLWNRIGGSELADLSRPPEPILPTVPSELPPQPHPLPDSAATESENLAETEVSSEQLEAVGVHVATAKREPTVIRRRPAPKPPEDDEPDEDADALGPAPVPASRDEWQDAIRKAQAAETRTKLNIPEGGDKAPPHDDGEEEDITLQPGDVLHHPALGRCTIASVDDEVVHVKAAGTGKIRKMSLIPFELQHLETEENGRQVYRLKKRRQR